jgi:hypothetical protein
MWEPYDSRLSEAMDTVPGYEQPWSACRMTVERALILRARLNNNTLTKVMYNLGDNLGILEDVLTPESLPTMIDLDQFHDSYFLI